MAVVLESARARGRRLLRRAVLRAVRPQAAIQARTNAELTAGLQRECDLRAATEALAARLARAAQEHERRLTRTEDLLRETVITAEMQRRRLVAAERLQGQLEERLAASAPAGALEIFDDPRTGRVLGYRGAAPPPERRGGTAERWPVYLELLRPHGAVLVLDGASPELLAGLEGTEVSVEERASLEQLGDASAGALFSSGPPADGLAALLAQARRILRPDGVLLAELRAAALPAPEALRMSAEAGLAAAHVFVPGERDWTAAGPSAEVYALLARA